MILKYGRNDALDADHLGLRFIALAGYDPNAMIGVMKILEEATGAQGRQSAFTSTHPSPENRIEHIQAAIAQSFPTGVPQGLKP